MATQPLPQALRHSVERPAWTASGYAMLLILLVAIVVVLLDLGGLSLFPPEDGLVEVLCMIVAVLVLRGFYTLQPNQAVAITLFGSYKGTDRATGLRWSFPGLGRASCRCARTTSSPSGSRSTTCAATRSRSRRRWCGA